jgi:hypothetical protein
MVIAYWFAAAVTFYWTWRWSMAARGDLDRTAGV